MKLIVPVIVVSILIGAGAVMRAVKNNSENAPYTQIDQETAKEMMSRDDGHIVLDVRHRDEYDEGHIPGAILLPNESITTKKPGALPDTEQVILIYCRSGNRSKQAAQKLANMGYTNIYEFGGINSWNGEIEKTSTMDLNKPVISPMPMLVVRANDKVFYANLESNSSAQAFTEKLSSEALEIDMHDYNNFEKVGQLPWELPTNDVSITTEPGDIILYQGNKITLYYGQNTWDFTRLAKINNVTKEELLEALGSGDVTVGFEIEWSE